MAATDTVTMNLHGLYQDVLRDGEGRVLWDSGVQKNVIVFDFRRLLAGFVHGSPTTTAGIQGLLVGAGNPAWDTTPSPPTASQTGLVDPSPYLLPASQLVFNYLNQMDGSPVPGPTNIVQIKATFGPGVPPWPESGPNPAHPTLTLREFGLVGRLNGSQVLLNSVRHPAIVKDPVSTLNRTLWLVF